MTAAATTDSSTKRKPVRKHSGTAAWHMSARAVDLSVTEVLTWKPQRCLEYFVETRFGSWKTVRCPYCGTVGTHCWKPKEKRWRCTGCRSSFSVTAGTVFGGHQLPLRTIIAATLLFANSAGGQPALELRRHLGCSYNTAYLLQQKLREGFVRGFNPGLVSGDIEMDGAHQSGRRSDEKRGRPQVSAAMEQTAEDTAKGQQILAQAGGAKEGATKQPALTSEAKRKRRETARNAAKGGVRDPEFGRVLPAQRRILFAIRQRSGVPRRGAIATRVGVGKAEREAEARSIVMRYIAVPESILNTDGSPAYDELGKRFMAHHQVDHMRTFSGPNGENNNQVEEFNGRYDRAEKGIYLNIEPKYLLEYACEVAFRSDTRRLSNGKQLRLALRHAMSVGPSLFWAGFTHGRHRDFEFLFPENIPAAASGPAKKRSPISMQNGRPPR